MSDIPEADRAGHSPHPRDVFDLLGHAKAEKTFLQAGASGRLHHAWLITGGEGIGKATLAYRMIRHLLGSRSLLDGTLDVPADDVAAGRISAQGHGNLHVVRRPFDPKRKKLKTEIPVSSIRELSAFFRETAAEAGVPRVGLIDKADELNASSENAVLKLLEEPPEDGFLFLLADAPGRLLPTIRSRCLSLDLRPVPDAELRPWVQSRTGLSGKDLERVLFLSRGSPGRALSLAERKREVVDAVSDLAESWVSGRRAGDVALVNSLAGPKLADARPLFWAALQDVLAAFARHDGDESWPLPFARPPRGRDWLRLWHEAVERERLESEINMDPRASLLDTLGDLRVA